MATVPPRPDPPATAKRSRVGIYVVAAAVGILVATVVGVVAVWALGANAAQGGAGSIAAVNEAAITVANWGSAIPTTVDDSDVQAAFACVGPPSGNV
jgi:hypothetical protein